MNTALASQLGALQAQIYWLHDAEEFDELAGVTSKIYEILGHDKERAEIAGRRIGEAYQLADNAESALKAGSAVEEMQFYTNAKEKLIQAEASLGFLTQIIPTLTLLLKRAKRILAVVSGVGSHPHFETLR